MSKLGDPMQYDVDTDLNTGFPASFSTGQISFGRLF